MQLALHQRLHHLPDLFKPTKHDLVPFHKRIALVLYARLLAKLPHQHLERTQIMPRHPREQMVHRLELQAAVQEVEPGRAVDVHGGAQLALGERLGGPQVRRRHAPVRQRDLHVQEHRHTVRDQHEADADRPRWQRAPQQAVAEERPVTRHHGQLDGARPPGGAKVRGTWREQVQPGEEVEVEASNGHDRVIGIFLVGDEEVGRSVPDEGEVVEGGEDGFEVGGGCGKERDVLNVRVVFLDNVRIVNAVGDR
jgi:hypothetical protein